MKLMILQVVFDKETIFFDCLFHQKLVCLTANYHQMFGLIGRNFILLNKMHVYSFATPTMSFTQVNAKIILLKV